jgi:hypothetical protein
MAKKITTYKLTDKLPFGKHKGQTIRQVLQSDPSYILWCVEKLDRFAMSDEAWDYAISINEQFATMRPKPTTYKSVDIVERTMTDGIEVLAHYPWRDMSKAREKFMKHMRQMAEDTILVAEDKTITPVQLTLF